MTYLARIDQIRRAELYKRARQFAANYQPGLPTIVILPGGMGSRLQRCTDAYDPATEPPMAKFYELWAGIVPILEGELAALAQNKWGEEADQHPVIAAGELTNIVKSYDGVFSHFAGRANVIGMGYDWRRAPLKECGYVRVFLQLLAEQVRRRDPKLPDPRKRLTLYAHSQGGLVAKLFVNDLVATGEDPADWFERLVTCCTPFYGTNSHFHRYYVGEPLLNLFTGGADAVSRIVATFEGTFILLPAPRSVLGPRLVEFGLRRYPVRDKANDALDCDPFDPATASRHRPEVPRGHLAFARDQFVLLDRPLPPAVSQRVFHIRSDIFGDASKSNLEIRWKEVDGAHYAAGEGNPVSDTSGLGGRGDGTVPLWSAALAGAQAGHVFDITGVRHGGAAEHRCSLDILANLMDGVEVPPGPHVAGSDLDYATQSRVMEIGAELQNVPRAAAQARLNALPQAEYRAFVDSLRVSA